MENSTAMTEQKEEGRKRGDLSLQEAVEVLNLRRHHGHSGWYVSGEGKDQVVFGEDQYEVFSPFETLAIAERYLAVGKAGG